MSLLCGVVYYSWGGNTAHLAEAIATGLSAPAIRLECESPRPSDEMRIFEWGNKQITVPRMPRLKPLNVDPASVDLLFLGSPIWKGSAAPPLCAFLETHEFSRRQFALFCSYSGRVGGYFQTLARHLVGNEIIGTIGFREPLRIGREASRNEIATWATQMYRKAGG